MAVAVAAPPATTGVAHTRWATHGKVTEENAHPHSDSSDRVHIVLNGIVENHARLRQRLEAEGQEFSSETDAEVVAHLIAGHYDGDLAAAVRAAFAELRGHYAFVAMHADHPGLLVGARKECPLVAGIGDGESFLASAIPAFLAETRLAVAIENDEIVTIDASGVSITDAEGNPVEREPEEIDWDETAAEKGGYETYMLKEIHEQADAVAETIAGRLPGDEGVDLSEVELDDDVPARHAADRDRRLRHLLPRRPRRPLRDRGVGAGAGRDGHRLRVPLPQPGGRRRTTWSSGSPSRARPPTPWRRCGSPASAAPRCSRSPTSAAARRRATPTRSSTPAPGSRSASPRPRPSSPRRRRCTCSGCGWPSCAGPCRRSAWPSSSPS